MAQDVRLGSDIIMQALGDTEFYPQVPAFIFLRKQGLTAAIKLQELIAKNMACEGCNENFLKGVITTFLLHTKDLHDLRPDGSLLKPLASYLQSRLPYEVGCFQLHYKDQTGADKVLSFSPEHEVQVDGDGTQNQDHAASPGTGVPTETGAGVPDGHPG